MTDQKIAIITGASKGIGKAISLSLIRDNYRVVLVSRSLEKLEKALAEAGKLAQIARVYSATVAASVQVEERAHPEPRDGDRMMETQRLANTLVDRSYEVF